MKTTKKSHQKIIRKKTNRKHTNRKNVKSTQKAGARFSFISNRTGAMLDKDKQFKCVSQVDGSLKIRNVSELFTDDIKEYLFKKCDIQELTSLLTTILTNYKHSSQKNDANKTNSTRKKMENLKLNFLYTFSVFLMITGADAFNLFTDMSDIRESVRFNTLSDDLKLSDLMTNSIQVIKEIGDIGDIPSLNGIDNVVFDLESLITTARLDYLVANHKLIAISKNEQKQMLRGTAKMFHNLTDFFKCMLYLIRNGKEVILLNTSKYNAEIINKILSEAFFEYCDMYNISRPIDENPISKILMYSPELITNTTNNMKKIMTMIKTYLEEKKDTTLFFIAEKNIIFVSELYTNGFNQVVNTDTTGFDLDKLQQFINESSA